MRIFITGIAGFIGLHVALFLKNRGHFVVGCDNFNAYYDSSLKRKRAEMLKEKGVEVFEFDICNPSLLEKVTIDFQITHLIHLAAQAGVRYSLQHPESYVHSNLDGFVHVMELLRKHPNIRCVYASSSSVYGANSKIPFSEEDRTDVPCNLYAATKKSNELMAYAYHHMFGIFAIGLRYFTVYGPWGRPDMAYFSFTQAIMQRKPLLLYNGGEMYRDFTYIDDIVKGTVAALEVESKCEVFNLGNETPEKIESLVFLLEKYTGKKAIQKRLPMQPGEVLTTYADISKSRRILGFSPQVSLEKGLEKFVSWYIKYVESSREVINHI